MIATDNNLNAAYRQISAKVELYDGSTLLNTFTQADRVKSFTVERVGEGKFFGFGICQKINLKLLDVNRDLSITTANSIKIYMGSPDNYNTVFPPFFVSEVRRDENTNELSITAYDILYDMGKHTISELELTSYTIAQLVGYIADKYGLALGVLNMGNEDYRVFFTNYEQGANFDGSETFRQVLDAVAEATQTIYYIYRSEYIVFMRLDKDGSADFIINKDRYFTLDSKTNRRLATITHTTELGDNVSASTAQSGSTQYIRDNPLWDTRDDIADLVNAAVAAVGGLTINQFECEWRGNYLVEIGDKLGIVTKDNNTVYSYLLDDTLTYDGGLTQKTRWSYESDETETESNPTSIGDALKQTFARVDKANRQIELVASETSANTSALSSLLINTDSIAATVQRVEESTADALSGINNELATLTNKVETTITAEDVRLSIESELSNGVDKVITNTGFTFDDEGLTVSKSDSEMTTTISEDGMIVYKNDDAMLTANNAGVNAANLHATTYLIIGNNSRFEDYGSNRTGCFWIGGE